MFVTEFFCISNLSNSGEILGQILSSCQVIFIATQVHITVRENIQDSPEIKKLTLRMSIEVIFYHLGG